MTTAIIGLFESSDIASKVLGELTKAGFKKDAVEILQNVAASRISSRLVEAGYEKNKAESYGKAMQKGAPWSWPKPTMTRSTRPSARCGASRP